MATVTKNFGNCNPGWQTPANWERDLDDQGTTVEEWEADLDDEDDDAEAGQ